MKELIHEFEQIDLIYMRLFIKKCYHEWTQDPVDTGRILTVHNTFRRHPGRLLNVLCTFNLRPLSNMLCVVRFGTIRTV